MELEEIKNVWKNMSNNQKMQKDFTFYNISDMTRLKYREQTNILRIGEIIGLFVAYSLTGMIL